MKKPVILLAERDDIQRHQLHSLLLRRGFEVIDSPDASGVFRAFRQKRNPDLLIVNASLDVVGDGLELAKLHHRTDRRLPIIVIATNSSESLAVAALRAGVVDYFAQPFSSEDLLASIHRCLSDRHPQEFPRAREWRASAPITMIGESATMQEIKRYLLKVASTDSNTLITGETGTGKELVAALIHQNSRRQQKPFVSINCAAIPDSLLESELFGYERGAFTGANTRKEGTLELADCGTVFFDEIGDMSLYAQAKILRAIESKEVRRLGGKGSIPLNFRFIAATNRDLERLMAEEKFRTDLYFRLNVASIHLLPLRERKEDLLALCDHYIREMNQRFGLGVEGLTEDAFACLLRYDWPGNVRELKNLIEASFINLPSQRISCADLPEQFRRRLRDADGLSQSERDRVLSALFSTNWNKLQAAQKLHWSRVTLYRKMTKYHIGKRRSSEQDMTSISGTKL